MAQEIPEEYLNGEFDFGFTAADEDELNALGELDDLIFFISSSVNH